MESMKYQKLFDTTIENGGATWNPKKDTFLRQEDGGFIVGEVVGTYKCVNQLTDKVSLATRFYIAIHQTLANFPNSLIGTWVDPEGIIHIDPVRRFASKDVAIGYGMAKGQLAIYDVENGKVIGLR
jgi:hypothetical protein